jgi:hypothetical protein
VLEQTQALASNPTDTTLDAVSGVRSAWSLETYHIRGFLNSTPCAQIGYPLDQGLAFAPTPVKVEGGVSRVGRCSKWGQVKYDVLTKKPSQIPVPFTVVVDHLACARQCLPCSACPHFAQTRRFQATHHRLIRTVTTLRPICDWSRQRIVDYDDKSCRSAH